MATKVFMEALSPTMEEGRLVKWLKNEGDEVKSGDPLAEVETDKAIMELVARGEGVLRKRLVGEGESRAVGTLVGVIAAPDENIDALIGDAGGAPAQAAGAAREPAAGGGGNGGRVRSSPLARRLASERGLDLGQVHGSGPGGRIIKRDIEEAAVARPAVAAGAPAARP